MYMVGGGAGEGGEVWMVVNVGNESENCSVGGSALMSCDKRYCDEDLSHWYCDYLEQPDHEDEDVGHVDGTVCDGCGYQRESDELNRYSSLLPMLMLGDVVARIG